MKKYTADNLMVKPINQKNLNKFLKKFIKLEKNQEFSLIPEALILHENIKIICDTDACGNYINSQINKTTKISEFYIEINIGVKTHTSETSYTYRSSHSVIQIFESELEKYKILDSEISLKDFMGSRYNYNPRISSNTKILIDAVNSAK